MMDEARVCPGDTGRERAHYIVHTRVTCPTCGRPCRVRSDGSLPRHYRKEGAAEQ